MYTRDVVDILEQLIKPNTPEEWDNTGILIDTGHSVKDIFMTVDITDQTIKKCVERKIHLIIAYHPVIFQGIKKIHRDDIVMKLIQNNISVYTPHTRWDGWMNKYLYEKFNDNTFSGNIGVNKANIREIVQKCKEISGNKMIRTAWGVSHTDDTIPDNMVVGVGSAFKYHSYTNSVILTGEMSHHCILHSVRHNNTVIMLEHGNSEMICLRGIEKECEGIFPSDHKLYLEKIVDSLVKLE